MPDSSISIEAKVAALRDRATYAGVAAPESIEAVETHMSWVFLAGDRVYKLKKSVREDHLDFSSLESRHFYCLEEVRLNRRLAPAVYLGVVPLTMRSDGLLRMGGPGVVVDWLVEMRRLPPGLMLDRLLESASASAGQMRTIATTLAEFHRTLAPAMTGPAEYLAHLHAGIDELESQLGDPDFRLAADDVRSLCARLRSILQRRPALFEARVRQGRIVEGHGDLRPEHICLATPPAIIDCLEFSSELRTLDTADELGFLALECERLGAASLARQLVADYGEIAGDVPDVSLIHFYQAFRACIRARIALRHLKEPRYRDDPKWPLRARHYLDLASSHLRSCEASLQPPGASLPAAA